MAEARRTARPQAKVPRDRGDAVAAYKRLLQTYIDRRPSGLRLKIAEALGKHKSFVTQITNPAYKVPVPARHLETIFKICHFSAEERETFLAAYGAAHPAQSHDPPHGDKPEARTQTCTLEIEIPVIEDPETRRRAEALIRDVARRVVELVGKG